jgi:hypothetical protein
MVGHDILYWQMILAFENQFKAFPSCSANSPACRGCGVKEETSAHVLCESEAWASLRHTHLGSFFLEPEDIKSLGLGAICSFGKAAGLS